MYDTMSELEKDGVDPWTHCDDETPNEVATNARRLNYCHTIKQITTNDRLHRYREIFENTLVLLVALACMSIATATYLGLLIDFFRLFILEIPGPANFLLEPSLPLTLGIVTAVQLVLLCGLARWRSRQADDFAEAVVGSVGMILGWVSILAVVVLIILAVIGMAKLWLKR
jgi:hypothetical protein